MACSVREVPDVTHQSVAGGTHAERRRERGIQRKNGNQHTRSIRVTVSQPIKTVAGNAHVGSNASSPGGRGSGRKESGIWRKTGNRRTWSIRVAVSQPIETVAGDAHVGVGRVIARWKGKWQERIGDTEKNWKSIYLVDSHRGQPANRNCGWGCPRGGRTRHRQVEGKVVRENWGYGENRKSTYLVDSHRDHPANRNCGW